MQQTTHQVYGTDMWVTHLWYRKHHTAKRFLEHINSIDPSIQFTVEETKADYVIQLLDKLLMPESDRFLSTTVYRVPNHMD